LAADYSLFDPAMLDANSRQQQARKILGILRAHIGEKMGGQKCLDIGCSAGHITAHLAGQFAFVAGVDVDRHALTIAAGERGFLADFCRADAQVLPFPEACFDAAVCNQVYQCVPSPPRLVREIYRVLKPGGCCFFSARNLWGIVAGANHRPFLARYAPFLTSLALGGENWERRAGRLLPYPALRELVGDFALYDYTWLVLRQPQQYGFDQLAHLGKLARLVPGPLQKALLPLLPNHLWVLQKQGTRQ
jgi:ubiquinone/menaquinone biosynthesis C-methylase UbiE